MTQDALSLDLVKMTVQRLRALDGVTVKPGLQEGDTKPQQTPSIIVFPVALDASDSAAPRAGAYQRVTVTLALVHVVAARNTQGKRGAKGIDPLDALLGQARGMLNGWVPNTGLRDQDALTLRRGRLVDLVTNRALWRDEYEISWRTARCQ